jgi:hypothetical protein
MPRQAGMGAQKQGGVVLMEEYGTVHYGSLGTKIFGEIAGKTEFAAGYPHGSPPAIPTRESRVAEEEQASVLMEAGQ